MNEPLMPRRWRGLVHSVQGASHVRSGTVNQDAGKAQDFASGGCIIAVADGHGHPQHARSDRGSRFAVDVAFAIVAEWLQRQADATEDQVRRSAAELPELLLAGWRQRVLDDFKANPPGPDEAPLLRIGNTGRVRDGEILYGSTLLVAAVAQRFAVYLQVGDGDIVAVRDDQPPSRPVSGRADLPVSQTDSLCQRDAISRFKHAVEFFAGGGRPDLILVATDGYANSFADDAEFLVVGRDLKQYLEQHGAAWVSEHLDAWLKETSEKGSGDDITLGLAWFASPEPAPRPKPPPPRIPWRILGLAAILLLILVPAGWAGWAFIVAPRLLSEKIEGVAVNTAGAVNAIAFSPDGTLIAAATEQGFGFWDLRTGKPGAVQDAGRARAATVAFAPNGSLVALGSENAVLLVDLATRKSIRPLPPQAERVASVVFSPDGTLLAYAAGDTMWTWPLQGTAVRFFAGHAGRIRSLAFAAGGKRLVSAGADGSIKAWDVETGGEVFSIAAHEGGVEALAVSPDGAAIASTGKDGAVKLWSADSGKPLGATKAPGAPVRAAAFSPDGKLLAIASGNAVTGYDAAGEKRRFAFAARGGPVTSLAFTPDGMRIAAGSEGKTIEIWALARQTAESPPEQK